MRLPPATSYSREHLHEAEIKPIFDGPMEPRYPCSIMPTRHCPAIYGSVCGDRPCARYESDDEEPWLPEILKREEIEKVPETFFNRQWDPLHLEGWTEPELQFEEDDSGMRVRFVMTREKIGPLTLEEFILAQEAQVILKEKLESMINSIGMFLPPLPEEVEDGSATT